MRYEHIVQINDLARADIPRLERSQLWLGLVARAERPELFDPSIDSTHELGRAGNVVELALRRGSTVTRDSVTLIPEQSVVIRVGDGTGFAGSSLTIAIEEPAPQALFLRFIYELHGAAVPDDEAEQRALRQAYYYADLETVQRIRQDAPSVTASSAGSSRP